MIRQAISCDICATEKKQTNNWFVAYEHGGELRVGGWNSRNRLRPGSKHLCGQTCLHKLVDDFMARALVMRAQPAAQRDAEVEVEEQAAGADTSLTSDATYEEIESSARLITPVVPVVPVVPVPKFAPLRVQPELVALPGRPQADKSATLPDEPPRYASRNWRAEAWDRERERELRATGRRSDSVARRRSGS